MNNYVSRLSNFDIMTICSNNFRAALSVFFDMGCPQITIKCTENGITITETDSAAAVVVAAAFERLSFQVYSIPKDGVIFTIDTSTIVQSLKTSSINCCTFFNFITDDNDVAEKFVVTRCTESMAKVAVGVDYNENDDQSVSIMKKKGRRTEAVAAGEAEMDSSLFTRWMCWVVHLPRLCLTLRCYHYSKTNWCFFCDIRHFFRSSKNSIDSGSRWYLY